MAALGAGAGAFTGDVEREKLRQGWAGIAQNQERIDLAADQQAYDQSWGNAIKQQDLANRQKEFQERSLKVDALIRAGQEEERQMASIKRLRESSLGNAIIAGEKSGGGILRQSQLNMFNSENQTAYDVAGRINPQTGKVYEDGLWHFVQFRRDGNKVVNGDDGSPIVERDIPISRELYDSVMSSEFGKYYAGKNSNTASIQAAKVRGDTAKAVANINAASRERVAKIQGETSRAVAGTRSETQLGVAEKNNASREKIAEMHEAGRKSSATMRNDVEWEKLAQGWEKLDNNLSVQMKKADTYGKRVDLLEQKLKNDYELGVRKAKTEEEKQKLDAQYKERKAAIEEGNLDLGWFKAENSADLGDRKLDETKRHNSATEEQQKKNEEGRNSRFDERTKFRREELEAKKANWNARVEALKNKINKSGKSGSEIKARLEEVKSLQGTLNGGNLTSDNRASLKKRMNAIAESVGMAPLPELPDPSPEPSPNPEGGDAGNGNPPSNKGDNSGGQALDDELTKRGYKKINGKWVKAK